MLLVYRLRGLALEREMLRVQAEAAAAEQLARTFLRLRDYANTPIQTIAFTTELLRAKNHDLKPILDRLERAVERLTELSRALTRYETAHKWSPGDESLDATRWPNSCPAVNSGNDRAWRLPTPIVHCALRRFGFRLMAEGDVFAKPRLVILACLTALLPIPVVAQTPPAPAMLGPAVIVLHITGRVPQPDGSVALVLDAVRGSSSRRPILTRH